MKRCGESKRYTIPLPTKLVDAIGDSSEKSLLEVGCGYGRACFFLRKNGFRVIGVDVDRVQIGLAQEERKSRGINEIGFLLNDGQNLCFSDFCFDAVTLLGFLP
jgi:ubiquinone/menaquinone biosynthesis C-methylase UbiE